jgi:multisubunit Na+/H+ antiporter MnhB subunit
VGGLTRAGGSSLVALVTGFSAEPALVQFTDDARLRHALIVLAVGGIVALLAALRTLRRTDGDGTDGSADNSDESADDPAD